MKIACAFDHAGFPLKPLVLETLQALGHETLDLGTDSTDPVDYPDTARDASEAVLRGEAERAVIVCGSGAGVAVAASKVPGIRAYLGASFTGEERHVRRVGKINAIEAEFSR